MSQVNRKESKLVRVEKGHCDLCLPSIHGLSPVQTNSSLITGYYLGELKRLLMCLKSLCESTLQKSSQNESSQKLFFFAIKNHYYFSSRDQEQPSLSLSLPTIDR